MSVEIFISIMSVIALFLIALFLWDIFQRQHAVLRNYPIVGHFRYLLESLGFYLRQYFYSGVSEELQYNQEL